MEVYETSQEMEHELHRDQELHRSLLLIFLSKMSENTRGKCIFLIIAYEISKGINQELDRGLLLTFVIQTV